jgi:trehalose-6-phosphate synthase
VTTESRICQYNANTMSASLIVRDRRDNLRAVAQKLEALNKLPGSKPPWRRKVALNPYQILLLEVDETRRVTAWRFLLNNCLF